MAILTPDQLKAQIDALIPTNTNGVVTEPVIREILTNMVDSLQGGTSTPDPDPTPDGSAFSTAFSTAFN